MIKKRKEINLYQHNILNNVSTFEKNIRLEKKIELK